MSQTIEITNQEGAVRSCLEAFEYYSSCFSCWELKSNAVRCLLGHDGL